MTEMSKAEVREVARAVARDEVQAVVVPMLQPLDRFVSEAGDKLGRIETNVHQAELRATKENAEIRAEVRRAIEIAQASGGKTASLQQKIDDLEGVLTSTRMDQKGISVKVAIWGGLLIAVVTAILTALAKGLVQ